MCWFFKKRKAKKQALQEEQLKMQQESMKKESIQKEKPAPQPVEPKPVVEPVKKVEVKKAEPKPEKEEPKPEKEEPKKVEDDKEDAKSKNPKYHVSQNKDAKSPAFKQWRVRKEGSNKTIKYFDTQAEAIEYAEDLAEKNDTSIVIHKLDGTIRKQDYQKKE